MEQGNQFTVLSVGQASEMLEKSDNNQERLLIAGLVIRQERIKGSADDYHNLAVTYTRDLDDYESGFSIIERGLQYYPRNIDLLADAVYYGSCAGKFDECEKYEKIIRTIPISLWNWRAFTFLIDYYLQQPDWIEDVNGDSVLDLTEKALFLAKSEQIALLGDADVERGFLAEHKIRVVRERYYRLEADACKHKQQSQQAEEYEQKAENEREESEVVLRKAIEKGTFAATGCCLKLADILFEKQDFPETIKVCNTALRMPQSQPSANLGYFLYLIAMSQDAIIQKESLYREKDKVEELYRMYLGAYRCNRARSRYKENICNRVAVMEALSGLNATDFNREVEEEMNKLSRFFQ